MTKNSGVNDIPNRVVITYYRAVGQSCKESINSLKSFITFNIVMLYISEKYFLHRITYSIHKHWNILGVNNTQKKKRSIVLLINFFACCLKYIWIMNCVCTSVLQCSHAFQRWWGWCSPSWPETWHSWCSPVHSPAGPP